jgi:hypothetical protein
MASGRYTGTIPDNFVNPVIIVRVGVERVAFRWGAFAYYLHRFTSSSIIRASLHGRVIAHSICRISLGALLDRMLSYSVRPSLAAYLNTPGAGIPILSVDACSCILQVRPLLFYFVNISIVLLLIQLSLRGGSILL